MIKLDDFTDKRKKELYATMNPYWNKFDEYIKKTPYGGSTSNNSYSLNCDIKDVFNIEDTEQVKKKFEQAVSGSGNESEKIKTLHSSSLCAFLFFYNISENNKLELELNENRCVFHEVFFEYKNKVTESGGPSNIDVVLLGKNCKTGKKAILFLESKFSEYYLSGCQTYHIKNAYRDINPYGKIFTEYKNDFYKQTSLRIEDEPNSTNDTFIMSADKTCYIGGVKQMFAHFVGVNNFINGTNPNYYTERDDRYRVANYKDDNTEVYLGEILYSPDGDSNFKKSCDKYSELYSKFYNFFKKYRFFDSKVRMVDYPFYYKDIFATRNCNSRPRKFYFGF